MNFIYPFGLPIALSLTAYNAFLTGLMVLLKRRDAAGLRYFISSFTIFLWGVGITFMLNNEIPASTAQAWGIFSQMAALFIPATWLHFVLAYTNTIENYKRILRCAYFLTFALFPFTLTKHFVAGFHSAVGINQYPTPAIVYKLFTALFGVIVPFSFWVFGRAVTATASQEKKKDYKMVCFASLYGFVTGSLAFLPVYGISLPQYNLLLMPIWQILLTYGMIRHQIFDIEKIVQAARHDKLAAIGTLAASINHEIRNPLYIIQGLSESLLTNLTEGIFENSESALEKCTEVLGKTTHQATRAMEIMKRFAVFAKQNVRQTPETQSVNLSQIVEDILPLVGHELELDKIALTLNIPRGLSFQADLRHTEEILFNLLVNACQAMKEMGGRIRIAAERQNGHVNILVEDNGPGIAAEQLSQIFEPFFTTKQEGTGLGLYVTKQLVERNGGKISVKSKLGEGSRFILQFKAGNKK